jgi:hypothetical protein
VSGCLFVCLFVFVFFGGGFLLGWEFNLISWNEGKGGIFLWLWFSVVLVVWSLFLWLLAWQIFYVGDGWNRLLAEMSQLYIRNLLSSHLKSIV